MSTQDSVVVKFIIYGPRAFQIFIASFCKHLLEKVWDFFFRVFCIIYDLLGYLWWFMLHKPFLSVTYYTRNIKMGETIYVLVLYCCKSRQGWSPVFHVSDRYLEIQTQLWVRLWFQHQTCLSLPLPHFPIWAKATIRLCCVVVPGWPSLSL